VVSASLSHSLVATIPDHALRAAEGDDKGGWDHCFDFGRGFDAPDGGWGYPPVIYVVGSEISRWGVGKARL
jgi:hypothetical protein